MSDTASNDMLMYFKRTAGEPALAAESRSALVGSGSGLMKGFENGKYFEAENLSFGLSLADDEGGGGLDGDDSRDYARWRGLSPNEPKPLPPFLAEPSDVSITRLIDTSSPILLKHCLEGDFFHEAVLVKRSRLSTSGIMSAILRMEFSKVWLRAIEWEDGDTVRETCKFKYASLLVTYVQRKPDGSPGANWACSWTSPPVKPKR